MEITYLLNSGFLIRDDRTILIFDDFEDPAKVVDRIVDEGNFDNLYIFVSHAHFDHFGTHIRAYSRQTTRYIFSYDLKHTKRIKIFPQDNITLMRRYSEWQDDNIHVWTYDSTDVGVSFLVEMSSGKKIFHAGDFNWWNWEGDTLENRLMMEKIFKKQLKRMEGLEADAAFFPVDGRLGNSQEMGAKAFLEKTRAKFLIAMHRVGYPQWQPSADFFENRSAIPVWAPLKSGESIIINSDGDIND